MSHSINTAGLSDIALLRGPVMVTGAGVSGVGAARLLIDLGVDAVLVDSDPTALNRASEATGARTMSVEEAAGAMGEFSGVVTSPGWRPDSPLLVQAAEAGLEVVGDVELFYRLDRAGVFGAPRTWMVVTGTNGKTTTTSMLAAMMKQAGFSALAVGNIGVSISEALLAPERVDVLVAELSSFQLHWSSELTPDVGVLLNLADDHIDWHGSFAAYAEAKAKVLRGKVAIAGIDDEHVREQVARLGITPVGFTLGEPEPGQVGVKDGQLVDRSGVAGDGDSVVIAPVEGIEPPGPAGVYDALAAAAAARAEGASPESIAQALQDFHVAGHRGQIVGCWRDASGEEIVAIDNSKATNPHAADSALAGYDSVVWVAGGQLKGAEIDPLIQAHAHRLKAVALLGVDRELIASSVRRFAPDAVIMSTESTDPQSAIDEVVAWSVAQASGGDAVILAPAAASLDMFSGMGQRGTMFAEAIASMVDNT
ncbi:UDP-N-acetylmuramoyl-L-alanine--D-glutamate ligase [Corynebacterium vitaeruminis]|uniref:UDP-N-acetylmuramoyl-L-alanine--D-glutamate ligase n=1 Tax=Corynebacterium vitaeruminis TaxID=38305 RepID=UPI000554FF8C|nr:UDP-N-acetylmuramoyl-L-alanine--D-glutamate ligase [Corynebacterium vitaeruminis]